MTTWKIKVSHTIIAIAMLLLPYTTYADNNSLTIINHFNQTLSLYITINPDVLPDFQQKFTLSTNEQIQSRVAKLEKEAYISVRDATDDDHSAFFGVEIQNNQTEIHGYISHGIAFSWKNETVTFCTPDEYKKKRSC